MGLKILTINPGSTSTKIALFEDKTQLFKTSLEHSTTELNKYEHVMEQYEMRFNAIADAMKANNAEFSELAAVVGRGGSLPPVKSGAYIVNDVMINRLKDKDTIEHASNLGAMIALKIAGPLGIPAFIYDSVAVDELEDIARITGLAEVRRRSLGHALNSRAAAMKTAENLGKDYKDLNMIVVHLGGGISITLHKHGKMADIVSDDEGPFSPERSGRVPGKDLVKLCDKYGKAKLTKMMRGGGGLVSLLGTNSALKVEEMILSGDENAKLVYDAMAYQVSKAVGELSTVVEGKVDRIVITGGIAYSKLMTSSITKRVEFIAPVVLVPGENELEALAFGGLRVLKGEEEAHIYTE